VTASGVSACDQPIRELTTAWNDDDASNSAAPRPMRSALAPSPVRHAISRASLAVAPTVKIATPSVRARGSIVVGPTTKNQNANR